MACGEIDLNLKKYLTSVSRLRGLRVCVTWLLLGHISTRRRLDMKSLLGVAATESKWHSLSQQMLTPGYFPYCQVKDDNILKKTSFCMYINILLPIVRKANVPKTDFRILFLFNIFPSTHNS